MSRGEKNTRHADYTQVNRDKSGIPRATLFFKEGFGAVDLRSSHSQKFRRSDDKFLIGKMFFVADYQIGIFLRSLTIIKYAVAFFRNFFVKILHYRYLK
jgi:hypothetical protein